MTNAALDILRGPISGMGSRLAIPALDITRAKGAKFTVQPPGSKSLTNRALLLGALSEGTSTILGALHDADDAQQMVRALRVLGAVIESPSTGTWTVTGVGGRWRVPPEGVKIDINNAGTAARFLAAAALLSPGPITLDGSPRMRQRPIGSLVDVLRVAGASVEYLGAEGSLPIRIDGVLDGPRPCGVINIPPAESSQFVSALLLIGPWIPSSITLRSSGAVTSASYIAMTLGLLSRLGASVQHAQEMRVMRSGPPADNAGAPPPGLDPFVYDVEPDASGATYFWGAAALVPGLTGRVRGIGVRSLQGDAEFPGLLERMGVSVERETVPGVATLVTGPATLSPVLADMGDMPDAVMTAAVIASFAQGASVLRGVRTLRFKESDRIAALTNELAKIGVTVQCPVADDEDVMSITPPEGGVDCSKNAPCVEFDTYDDHRMAMSLSLIGLRRPNVVIREPGCVGKTYPSYWRDFASVCEAIGSTRPAGAQG